ncbi:MAG: hypothetical protein B6241_05140 [Spirochaetaceae bacterium 4572_59]|nr:MAG: hypothetical protein B6241_05140 [Spirochaetaceae bacterium 4572_59]
MSTNTILPKRNTNIPASYLVLIKDAKVLLLQRKNTGFMDGWYSFIAGHADKGESFTQAAVREAREEAGLELDPKKIKVSHMMHRNSDDSVRMDVFFTVESWKGTLENREPEKCSDLSWFFLEDLPEKTIPYIRDALNYIRAGISYSEYGW